jgi:iron complex transport system substrate-binding protein
LVVVFVLLVSASPLLAKPQRIASINLCTDQLVVLLAERAAIVSLYRSSADPAFSSVAAQARGLHLNRGLAEEIMALEPDLVVAGIFTARPAVALLRRRGVRVVELPLADSFAAIRRQIEVLAAELGEEERGRQLIGDMERRLARVAAHAGSSRSALAVGPNFFTNGRATLFDEVLNRAGLRNVAADQGLTGFARLDLEQLVRASPDVIIMPSDPGRSPSLAVERLAHPAIRHTLRDRTLVSIPSALWPCGGPLTVEAVERIVEATR